MADENVTDRIERLVKEEKELREREERDRPDDDALQADQERLRSVEIELDRCWDLLRQRRALREFDQDPGDAEARDAGTVENYEQ